jgi:hypothetical protein
MLSDGRQFFLNTDAPTYVVFTFASLAAIAIYPEGYGGRVLGEKASLWFDGIRDKNILTQVKEYRKTLAGKFVLRIYKDQRLSKI